MSTPFVPPGGAAGLQQQTPAAKAAMGLLRARSSQRATRRKRKAKKVKRAGAKKRAGGRKLKFGSPAWRKKYMKKR